MTPITEDTLREAWMAMRRREVVANGMRGWEDRLGTWWKPVNRGGMTQRLAGALDLLAEAGPAGLEKTAENFRPLGLPKDSLSQLAEGLLNRGWAEGERLGPRVVVLRITEAGLRAREVGR